MRTPVGQRLTVVLLKVLIEWIELIVFDIVIGSKWMSVKCLTSRWISGALEYEPISPTYLGATDRDDWGRKDDGPRCKRGSGATGRWQGGPRSRKYHFSIENCYRHKQQRIWTRVFWWGIQATECPSDSPINIWPCSTAQVFNSRTARNEVSARPGPGHIIHCEVVGLGYWYARSTGGGWNRSWKDFHLGGSSNDMQIAH